jgi:hypothetical protein
MPDTPTVLKLKLPPTPRESFNRRCALLIRTAQDHRLAVFGVSDNSPVDGRARLGRSRDTSFCLKSTDGRVAFKTDRPGLAGLDDIGARLSANEADA